MPFPDLGSLRQDYLTAANVAGKTADHLRLIAPYNTRELRFEPELAALVVVDMQRCFLESSFPLFSANGRAVVPGVAGLVEYFRRRSRPVIFAAQMNKGDQIDRGQVLRRWWPATPLEGSRDTELAEGITPLAGEKIIPKRRYSAFHATDLELTLRSQNVRQVVVAGVFTNVCVEATVRDAFMRDFFVFVPADATAAINEELQLGSLRTMALWFAKITTTRNLTAC